MFQACYVCQRCARYDDSMSDDAQLDSAATVQDDSSPQGSYVGRRFVGLGIDWLMSLVIASAFFPAGALVEDATVVERAILAGHPLATLAIFAVQHCVLVSTLGFTIGHRVVRLRLVRSDGAPTVGFFRGAVRTALLLLVIPAVVWDAQGRGLHDMAAGTHFVTW